MPLLRFRGRTSVLKRARQSTFGRRANRLAEEMLQEIWETPQQGDA
jgi:hypothetical protein